MVRLTSKFPSAVLPPFQFPGELAALVYLLNPTAGLLDGDGHLVEIDARPGSCALVTGQSSTRIHPAVRGFATRQWRVKAAADSQLVLLPGPNIPFRGCRYHQKAAIDLDPGARLIWGDIWTPGRYARMGQEAEFHQFERIVQDLEVRRDGGLVFRDHFTWDGPWDKEQACWYVGGQLAAASGGLFVTGNVELRLFRFLVRASRDLWAFLLGEGRFPRHSHLSPEDPELPALGPAGPLRRVVLPLAHGDTRIRWCGPVPELTLDLVRTALRIAASCVPADAVDAARQAGHDLARVREFMPGADDDRVLAQSIAEQRVLLTFDKDVGELAFRQGKKSTHGVILLRPKLKSPAYVSRFLVTVLAQTIDWEGHFCVAREGRPRTIPLPA